MKYDLWHVKNVWNMSTTSDVCGLNHKDPVDQFCIPSVATEAYMLLPLA